MARDRDGRGKVVRQEVERARGGRRPVIAQVRESIVARSLVEASDFSSVARSQMHACLQRLVLWTDQHWFDCICSTIFLRLHGRHRELMELYKEELLEHKATTSLTADTRPTARGKRGSHIVQFPVSQVTSTRVLSPPR